MWMHHNDGAKLTRSEIEECTSKNNLQAVNSHNSGTNNKYDIVVDVDRRRDELFTNISRRIYIYIYNTFLINRLQVPSAFSSNHQCK